MSTYTYLIIFVHLNVSENENKISRQAKKIKAIPSIDSWLLNYQQNLYSKSIIGETNTQNIQLLHQYKDIPSLMPIVNIDQLKTITLNNWS